MAVKEPTPTDEASADPTQAYLTAIQEARATRNKVKVDFASMPEGVDRAMVLEELGQRLPDEHKNAMRVAMKIGRPIRLDFAQAPLSFSVGEAFSKGIAAAGAGVKAVGQGIEEATQATGPVLDTLKKGVVGAAGAIEALPGALMRKDVQQAAGEVATVIPRGWRGIGVTLQRGRAGAGPDEALTAGAEAVKPSYEPKPGEKVGAYAGEMIGWLPGFAAVGAAMAPVEAAMGIGATGVGAVVRGALEAGTASGIAQGLTEMAQKGEVDPMDIVIATGMGGAVGAGVSGAVAGYSRLRSAAGQRIAKSVWQKIQTELNTFAYRVEKGMGLQSEDTMGIVPVSAKEHVARVYEAAKVDRADAKAIMAEVQGTPEIEAAKQSVSKAKTPAARKAAEDKLQTLLKKANESGDYRMAQDILNEANRSEKDALRRAADQSKAVFDQFVAERMSPSVAPEGAAGQPVPIENPNPAVPSVAPVAPEAVAPPVPVAPVPEPVVAPEPPAPLPEAPAAAVVPEVPVSPPPPAPEVPGGVAQAPTPKPSTPPRPLVNPKASALYRDKQLRDQQRWDKKYGKPAEPEAATKPPAPAEKVPVALEDFEHDLGLKGQGEAPNGASYLLTHGTNSEDPIVERTFKGVRDTIVGFGGNKFETLNDARMWAIQDGQRRIEAGKSLSDRTPVEAPKPQTPEVPPEKPWIAGPKPKPTPEPKAPAPEGPPVPKTSAPAPRGAPEPAEAQLPVPRVKPASFVNTMKAGINKRTTLPILRNVMVEKGQATVTDLETYAVRKTDLPDGIYEFVGNDLVLTPGNRADFPVIPEVKDVIGTVPREDFIQQFERTAKVSSTDETRYVLNSVMLESDGKDLRFVATDGRRISVNVMPGVNLKKGQYIVPSPGRLAKMLKGLSGDNLTVRAGPNQIEFSGTDGRVGSRLVDGSFPNWEQVIPTKADTQIIVDRKAIQDALKQVMPYVPDGGQVQLFATADSLTLRGTSINPDSPIKDVKIPATYREVTYSPPKEGSVVMPMRGEDRSTINFNPEFLKDAVDSVRGSKVYMGITAKLNPVHIYGKDISLPPGQNAPRSGVAKGKTPPQEPDAPVAFKGSPGAVTLPWDEIQDVTSLIWHAYSRPAEWTNFKALLGKYDGSRQMTGYALAQFAKQIQKSFTTRIQVAMTNYIEAAGDPKVLQARLDATKTSKLKEGYQDAMNLTPEQVQFAGQVKDHFEVMLKKAQAAGVLDVGVSNYVHHIWDRSSKFATTVRAEHNAGLLRANPALARQRIFETFFAGELLGYTPKDKRVGYLMTAYDQALNEAIAAREFVKSLLSGTASDGRPLAVVSGAGRPIVQDEDVEGFVIRPRIKPAETEDYRMVDHPALRKWKWVGKDTDDKPIYMLGDIVVHPEIVRHMRNILGRSAIRDWEVAGMHPGSTALHGIQELKSTLLSLSMFHQVQEGVHAVAHKVNPFNAPPIDFNNPVIVEGVEHGLMLYNHDALNEFAEGLYSTGLLNKVPGLGRYLQAYGHYLFQDYIPRLKMMTFLGMVDRNTKRFGNRYSRDRILELSAKQANAAYGELNYTMLGRNRTLQDIFRLIALAPDFLEARAKFVGQAMRPDGREQWSALLRLSLYMVAVAQTTNYLVNGKFDWDNPFSVTIAGKRYALRSIPGDILHLIERPRNFAYNRLNPTVMRPIIEWLTGRDQFGRVRGVKAQARDWFMGHAPIPTQGLVRDLDANLFDSILQSAGISANVARTRAEDKILEINRNKLPSVELSDESKAKANLMRSLKKDYSENRAVYHRRMREARRTGVLTVKDVARIEKASASIAYQARALSVAELVEVMKVAEPEEQRQLRSLLSVKMGRSKTMTPAVRKEARELLRKTGGGTWPFRSF